MLSETERKDIEAAAEEYKFKESACIEALKILQRRRGWVSDEEIKDLSEFFGMTVDELDSVATFYSFIFRRPVGRHIILVCDSVSCWVTGSARLIDYLKFKLGIEPGETTGDGRFTLLPIACLGVCEEAPAMIVDTKVHGNLDEKRIDEILERYP